jgi:hypothetical protein
MSTASPSVQSFSLTMTVLEALIQALNGMVIHNSNAETPPAVILWPDEKQQWGKLMPRLRAELPYLLTLGKYDPTTKTGPAIWLKCMIAGTLPQADWPQTTVPILYLPGVSRQQLRAVENCPRELQPLAELQYRGVFWSQPNSRDWTILAFLKSKEGLGLDVAQDQATLQAMQGALSRLAETPLGELQRKKLEAEDFNHLLTPDPVREVLLWLNEPDSIKAQWAGDRWNAFRSVCQDKYKFNPDQDGAITAAEKLGKKQDSWVVVWNRFAEAPGAYQSIPKLLKQAAPTEIDMFADRSTWPNLNEEAEEELRSRLLQLRQLTAAEAIEQIRQLEVDHGLRRDWVWAELGQAPLAKALEHLNTLADVAEKSLGGPNPQTMAEQYVVGGWQADAAVIQAIACAERDSDSRAVFSAIRTIYKPWLEQTTEHLQALIREQAYPLASVATLQIPTLDKGDCLLFVDGLRFDVAQLLKQILENRGLTIDASWQWVPLPTVTATSKPAVSPVAQLIQGSVDGANFQPALTVDSKTLTTERFAKLLETQEIQQLKQNDTGDPKGTAWTEAGELDKYGHAHGVKLAHEVLRQIRSLAVRIQDLLDAGWQRVQVVTDHGWLLMPEGLPKQDLPGHLAETRWGRCAVLKEASSTEIDTQSWFWSANVRIALPTGIRCFRAGLDYAHGGISLQECVTPVLTILGQAPLQNASIREFKWVGLRCRVNVDHGSVDMTVDIRTKPADASTSLAAGGKAVTKEQISLAIADDSTEGDPAIIVLMDDQGTVLAKQVTIIGGEK